MIIVSVFCGIFSIFLLVNPLIQANDNEDYLSALVVVMRHGVTTPADTYPTDPYNVSFWPGGLGTLTQIGIENQYELGQWLGRRYEKLFIDAYQENKIQITSSDFNRTIDSAKITIRGIFSNIRQDDFKFDEETLPVETLPVEKDNLVISNVSCAKLNELNANLLKSEPSLSDDDRKLYEQLNNATNLTIHNSEQAFFLHDILRTQAYHNLTLPDWTKDVLPELQEQAHRHLISPTRNVEIARLKVGPLWNKILSFFKDYLSSPRGYPRVLIVSGHDYTLVNLLNSIGAFDNSLPSFSSCIILELRKTINNDKEHFFVKSYLKNSEDLVKIQFQNCTFRCRIEDVVSSLVPLLIRPIVWEDECNPLGSPYIGYLLCGIGIALLLLCLKGHSCYLNYRKRQADHTSYVQCSQTNNF